MGSHSGSLSTAEREAPPQQTKWLTLMLLRRSVTSTTGMARASSTSSSSATSCTPWATTPPRRCASALARPTRRARSSPSSTTSSPRRTCRRCSPRSATLRMRTASSPTCPSWTGSLARPKNPTKLQSQASRRPWQHGPLLKKIRQLPSPLGVTKQHQKQPKLQDLHNHLQTRLHNHHQKQGGAWRIYIKPKHFCLS